VRRLVRDANPFIRWGQARREAAALYAEYGLPLDANRRVADLAPVERALLAIVRAFREINETAGESGGGLLILDEPTPFLSRADVERLFALVRSLVKRGASVIFVSHDVDEVMEMTDRATVLRKGRVAATLVTPRTSKADFIAAIVGHSLDTSRPAGRDLTGAPAVQIEKLEGSGIAPFDLTLHHGEVVGRTSLIGSGYDRIPYFLYGAEPASGGRIVIAGRTIMAADLSPARAMGLGMAFVPGDRQGAAIADGLSVAENMALPVFGRALPRFLVTNGRILRHAIDLAGRFDVLPRQPEMQVRSLSGGNQQKVVLAKWLQMEPRLILLDEPAQGVDVGARQQVYGFIREAAARGACVVCASSDHEQLESICDRVLIFSRGRVVATLAGKAITKAAIAERCLNSLDGTSSDGARGIDG